MEHNAAVNTVCLLIQSHPFKACKKYLQHVAGTRKRLLVRTTGLHQRFEPVVGIGPQLFGSRQEPGRVYVKEISGHQQEGREILVKRNHWPCWRGPQYDGISREAGVTLPWSTEPKVLWELTTGAAFSAVTGVGDLVYTCGTEDGKQVLLCLNAGTGDVVA